MLGNFLRRTHADEAHTGVPAKSGIDWCLDEFEIRGNVVRVRGWLFDRSNPSAENRVVVLDDSGRELVNAPVIPAGRPDIALHEQTLDAVGAGFEAFFCVESPRPLYFFLKHADGELMPMGTVLANRDGAYAYVRSLTKEEADAAERQANLPNGGPADSDSANADNAGTPISPRGLQQPSAASSIPPMLAERMADASSAAVVAITHALGGGAEQYLGWKAADAGERGERFFIVRFDDDAGDFTCESWLGSAVEMAHFPDIETILRSIARVSSLWVNEVVGYPNVASMLPLIADFANAHGASLEFMMHDYGSICQSYNLINADGVFCDLPPYDACHDCFLHVRRDDFVHAGIVEYRKMWESFLLRCDVVTAFSESSRSLLERAYPGLARRGTVRVVPHEVAPLRRVTTEGNVGKTTVGVLGVLSRNKGLDVVRDLVTIIDQNDTGLEFVLVGEATEDIPAITRRQTGRYRRDELPDIVEREGVDIVLIPSIWPETFSFTVSEAMDMDLPVAVFDIGAPAERVRRYGKGLVMRMGTKPADMVDMLRNLKAFCS